MSAAAGSVPIRVGVAGAAGRMGQTVCEAVEGAEDMELAGRADPALGTSLREAIDESSPDVVVDFSIPETVFENAILCLEVVDRIGLEIVHKHGLQLRMGENA